MDQGKYHSKCGPKMLNCGGKVQKKADGGILASIGRVLGTDKAKAIDAAEKFAKEGLSDEAMRSAVANEAVRKAQQANAKDK